MIDIEKVLTVLELCGSGKCTSNGEKCPYWKFVGDCSNKVCTDAAAAIRELVEENERLRAELYNCRLYLTAVKKHIDSGLFETLMDAFDGMPGYFEKVMDGETDEV